MGAGEGGDKRGALISYTNAWRVFVCAITEERPSYAHEARVVESTCGGKVTICSRFMYLKEALKLQLLGRYSPINRQSNDLIPLNISSFFAAFLANSCKCTTTTDDDDDDDDDTTFRAKQSNETCCNVRGEGGGRALERIEKGRRARPPFGSAREVV